MLSSLLCILTLATSLVVGSLDGDFSTHNIRSSPLHRRAAAQVVTKCTKDKTAALTFVSLLSRTVHGEYAIFILEDRCAKFEILAFAG
jgi:hypothetical protein